MIDCYLLLLHNFVINFTYYIYKYIWCFYLYVTFTNYKIQNNTNNFRWHKPEQLIFPF